MKNLNKKTLKKVIEDFRDSDSVSATAAKFILMTLALGGIVFVGALAPAIFSLVQESKRGGGARYSKKKIQGAVNTLKHRKLIEIISEKNGKIKVQLTNKGEKRIRNFCFETLKIEKSKKWDKKWRVLIFDIPTRPKIYNKAREALRHKIKKLGFTQIQKSVWAYPYECEDEILFLANIYNVDKYIEMLTVEKFLHESRLRKKFNL